jgi:enolase
MKIKSIYAREILDSRGNPTVETELTTYNNVILRASVPSGASTGKNEALELRDNADRYGGKGVLKAVENVNKLIAPMLIGKELDQIVIDKYLIELDGTDNKSNLGANAILSVSLCVMKAIAAETNKTIEESLGGPYMLPIPMMNIINGGVHASSGLEIQEFMIVPKQTTFKERLRCGAEVFHSLKKLLSKAGYSTSVGDEGGFAPTLNTIEEAFDYIMEAIRESKYMPGIDVCLAIDAAASEFYDGEMYTINKQKITKDQLVNYYVELTQKYPIISLEDAFSEDDIESMKKLTALIGNDIMLVGDDFFVTNKYFLQKGIDEKYNNAILLKANQIGTVSEMLETVKIAKDNSFKTIISHRSGETEDTFIASMAVGLNIDYIKTGSLSRGERIAKYNELLRIEERVNN